MDIMDTIETIPEKSGRYWASFVMATETDRRAGDSMVRVVARLQCKGLTTQSNTRSAPLAWTGARHQTRNRTLAASASLLEYRLVHATSATKESDSITQHFAQPRQAHTFIVHNISMVPA